MRVSFLTLLISLCCLPVDAQTWTFSADALGEIGKNVDLSLFNQGLQQPGIYQVHILLNGEWVDSRDVLFTLITNAAGKASLEPCLTVKQLTEYGIREDLPGLTGDNCLRLTAIPQLTTDFQFNQQRLLITVPQTYLRPIFSGIAPQQRWDDGIPALLMNYSGNVNHTEYRNTFHRHNDAAYWQLSPGANLGAWRLRNQSYWQKEGAGTGKWQTVFTYAERGLYNLKSRLTLGEKSTQDDVFSAIPFRGVMLASDDMMVPYSQRESTPGVRGIARTAARVEVRQNGYTIYNTNVSPGPFELTGLAAAGASRGELQVTVWETDGPPQMFTVPYQMSAIALHQGHLKYSLMGGQYRPASSNADGKPVAQATLMYGLPWNLTVYSGMQGAEHYRSLSVGLGISMGNWGAISLDGTGANGQRRYQDAEHGATWRWRYSKYLTSTGTNIALASYQYASSGYSTLQDVLDSWVDGNREYNWHQHLTGRRRSETSAALSQSLGKWGRLDLSGSRTLYQNRNGGDERLNAGYTLALGIATLSLNWSHLRRTTRTGHRDRDDITTLWLSMPLGRWTGGNTSAMFQTTSSSPGNVVSEAGLNGHGFDRQLYWDVRESYRSGDHVSESNSSAMLINWGGRYGQIGGRYRYSPQMRQMGADLRGGMVLHRAGFTLGQSMSDTVALAAAPGVSSVPVGGWAGVKTDARGYALTSGLVPYQENIITLDPANLPDDAEILQTDVKLVPTQGAVIAATFATRVGGRVLMTIIDSNRQAVPFGALVTLEGQAGSAGIVGAEGQSYLTGLPPQGQLKVSWSGATCRVAYQLPEKKGPAGIYNLEGLCH